MSNVSSGQTVSGATVTSSVNVLSGGSVVGSTVAGGGHVFVSAGATASGDTVAGGYLIVSSGGAVSGTTVQSGYLILSGASTSGTTVSGGDFEVGSGGAAFGTTVLTAGDFGVDAGAVASGTVFNGSFDAILGTDSGTTFSGAFYEVEGGGMSIAPTVNGGSLMIASGGQVLSAAIGPLTTTTVSSGGSLVSPTISGGFGQGVILRPGGQVVSATLRRGATIDFAGVPFVSGAIVTFNAVTDVLAVTEGGTTQTLQLAGAYTGDTFTASAEPGGPTDGSTIVTVLSATTVNTNSGSGTNSGTSTNTINLGNGGSVTVTTQDQPVGVSTSGPFTTLSAGSNGATVTGAGGSAVLGGAGLVTLLPVTGGIAVPLATGSPLQTALLQDILALGQTTTSRTVYLPGQSSVMSSSVLATQVLVDLPERTDTITGTAGLPVADIVLANPGATYITAGTPASIVVATDGAPATIINNAAGDALIAATGAAGNRLEGLAGANQFVTGTGGQDAVLLYGAANALTTNGADAALVGGPSTVVTAAGGLDLVAMTSATTLAFVDQSAGPAADSITGAAGCTVVFAGTGSAVVNAGAGTEGFVVDTSAGNLTLNGAAAGGDTLLFVRDAAAGSAAIVVNGYTGADTLAVHGYAAMNVMATSGGAVLSLSDGSSVTFAGASVAAIQQAVKLA